MWQLERMHLISSHLCSNSRYQDPGWNTFVPKLTLLSVSLQNMASVKTCGNWRSQECPVEMFMPNVSDKTDIDQYVLAYYQF